MTPSTTGFIDSPQAVAVANANGGTTFLSSHAVGLEQFVAQASIPPSSFGVWMVESSTCALSQSSGSGLEFLATVNATSGALTGASTVSIFCTTPGQQTYGVGFMETGLGSGASWSVTLGSVTESSSGSSIQFGGMGNGSYSFSVTASGYTADPESGSVTVAGGYVTEAITFTSSGGGGSAPTYSQAEAAAATLAAGYSGGGWSPSASVALALPSASSDTARDFENSTSGCTISWIGTPPSSIQIPATSGSAQAGGSAFWIIIFAHPQPAEVLVATVSSGTATLVYSGTGGSCEFFVFSTVGLIDSSQAVSVANSHGTSAWLTEWPNPSQEFLLIGRNASIPYHGSWYIAYSTCSAHATSGTGYFFNATVNATNGAWIGGGSSTGSCAGGLVHAGPPALSEAAARGASEQSALLRAGDERRTARSV